MSAQSPLFPVSDQTTDIAACLKQKATQYEFSGVRSALWVAREERRNDLRDLSDKLLMQRELAPGNTDTSHTVNRRECFHFRARSWRRLIAIDHQHRDRRLSRQSQKLFACFDRIELSGHRPD